MATVAEKCKSYWCIEEPCSYWVIKARSRSAVRDWADENGYDLRRSRIRPATNSEVSEYGSRRVIEEA